MEEMRSLAGAHHRPNYPGFKKPMAQEDVSSHDSPNFRQGKYVPIPNHDHNKPDKRATRPRTSNQSQNWWDRLWIAEMLSCLLAILALAAVVIILAFHQNKPMPQWPSLISINSLVSIFTSIMKAAMLLPVAEGIGELKWLWFAQPRALVDLDRFDSASRGPWGSLALLFRIPRSYLAVFGAVITIAALAIDPFIQQILQYYNCLEPIAGSVALIPRTNNYTAAGMHTGAGQMSLDGPMAATLYMGMLNPPANASSSIPVTCPTGNCTFSAYEGGVSYSSLAMCSSTEDISHTITGNGTYQNYKLPSGAHTGLSVLFSTAVVNTMQYLHTFDALMANTVPCNSSAVDGDMSCPLKPWAVRCSLYPCLHTYGGNVSQSVLDERIISTTPLPFMDMNGGDYFSLAGNHPSFPSIDCTPSDQPTDKNTVPTSRLSNGLQYVNYTATSDDADTQYYSPSCTWQFGIGSTQALTEYLYGLFNDKSLSSYDGFPDNTEGDAWLEQLYRNGTANLSTTKTFMAGLANAMTATMRQRGDDSNSAPAEGTVRVNQTCINVQWAWIALPAALMLATLLFLAATVLQSRRAIHHGGRPAPAGQKGGESGARRLPWKSSSLPLVWCGLRDKTRGRYGRLDDLDQMKESAETVRVQLRRLDEPVFVGEEDEGGADGCVGAWRLMEGSRGVADDVMSDWRRFIHR